MREYDFSRPLLSPVLKLGLLAEGCRQFLECCRLLAAEENARVTVADDRIGVILIQCLQLALRLKDETSRNLAGTDRRHEFLELRDLPDIRRFVDQTPHMNWEPPAVEIIGFFAQKIEKLGIHHADEEVERVVCIAHDEEKGGFPIPDGVQLQFILRREVPQFLNVERCEASAA